MGLSREDSENLKRIADALDPPPTYVSSEPRQPWPAPIRIFIGGVAAALITCFPVIFIQLFARDLGTFLFFGSIAFGMWVGWKSD
jgi:hypothetical protein